MISRFARHPTGFLLVAAAVVVSLAFVMLVLTLPGRWELLLRWYLLAVGVLAVVGAIHALTLRTPVDVRRPKAILGAEETTLDAGPPRLAELERLVVAAKWDAADFHARLRPVLWEIAAQRLATYEGIDLARNPAARERLGEAAWVLLAPRETTAARREGGVPPETIRAVVDQLEAIGGDARG